MGKEGKEVKKVTKEKNVESNNVSNFGVTLLFVVISVLIAFLIVCMKKL